MSNTALIVSAEAQKAHELHMQIMASGKLAGEAMVDFMKSLKTMRDESLYRGLGFDSFDDYVVEMVGIRARQAYNYISTLEGLGEKIVSENAQYGIKKLQLLAKITPLDREEFLQENDPGNMTAGELAEKVKELNGLNEQIGFLQEQLEAERSARENEGKQARKEGREAGKQEAKKELDKANAKLAAAEREKDAAVERAKEAALEEARKTAQAEAEARLQRLEAEKQAAAERALELEKQLDIAASTEKTEFAVLFGEWMGLFDKMLEVAGRLKAENRADEAEKLLQGLLQGLQQVKQEAEDARPSA